MTFENIKNKWLGSMVSDGNQLLFYGTGPGPWPVVSTDMATWMPASSAGVPEVDLPGSDPAVAILDADTLLVVANMKKGGK